MWFCQSWVQGYYYHFPQPAGYVLANTTTTRLAFIAPRMHYQLMFSLWSTRAPWFFSMELLHSHSVLSLYWCTGLLLPDAGHLSLHSILGVSVGQFLQTVEVHLNNSPALPSSISTIPTNLMSSANLLRASSVLLPWSLMKTLNSMRLSKLFSGKQPFLTSLSRKYLHP